MSVRAPLPKPVYTPSRWGEVFHNLPHHEALGAGSAGPGKTEALIWEPLTQIATEHDRCYRRADHPYPLLWGESKGWILHLRRTYIQLGQTILRTKRAYPLIDPGARWVVDTPEMGMGWIFSSGLRIQFGHCKDPDDWEMYQSAEFTMILYDELTSFNEEQYEQINNRLRTSDPVLRNRDHRLLKIRAMSNPLMRRQKGEDFVVHDPHWVRRRFVDPAPQGNVTLERDVRRKDGRVETLTSIYVPAKLQDNPDKEFVDSYELTLLNNPPHIRKALMDGDWYVLEGAFYAEAWNPTLHVCQPFRIPAHWPRWRSMDWGFKKHGCIHWWAMDEDGNIFCEREFSFKGKLIDGNDGVVSAIKLIERGLGIPWKKGRSQITGPADTQLWEKRGEGGKSKVETFAEEGVYWTQADKKSRQFNAEKFMARLLDHEGETTAPGIVFFETCKMALRTIPAIMVSKNNPEEPADGGEDHWHDSILYSCAYASHGKAGLGRATPLDDDDDEEYEQAREKRGKYGYGGA
jgi:hypothetical protein